MVVMKLKIMMMLRENNDNNVREENDDNDDDVNEDNENRLKDDRNGEYANNGEASLENARNRRQSSDANYPETLIPLCLYFLYRAMSLEKSTKDILSS